MPDARTRKSGLLDRTSALAAAANLPEFVSKLPKAELHVHIEGCLTPERCYQIVVRNGQLVPLFVLAQRHSCPVAIL